MDRCGVEAPGFQVGRVRGWPELLEQAEAELAPVELMPAGGGWVVHVGLGVVSTRMT